MAVLRQFNWLGQMRVDVPHLRLLESAVAGDFDALAGKILGGQQASIVSGFTVSVANAFGAQAKRLKVIVSGAAMLHPNASESGTIFSVPVGTAPETLDPTVNSNVSGSFAAARTNYVGVDLVRSVNSSTSDLVQFLDPDTLKETAQSAALARTLNYKFVISTKTFASTPNVAPIAIVLVDVNGNVTSITDARKLFYRLGTGGDAPNVLSTYSSWGSNAGTRREAANTGTSTDPFTGGDKGISSLRDWMSAIMTRLWEIGGGEFWYSPTSTQDVILTRSGATLSNGDYFNWNGTDLTWQGLSFVFANSTATTNQVRDQAVALAGTTNLNVGDCIFVDLDRTQNLSGASALAPVKGNISAVGSSTRPGSRIVIAWRTASGVFARGLPYPVGTVAPPASTSALGIVKLASTFGGSATAPEVPAMDATSGSGTLANVLAGGLTRGTTTPGSVNVGTGANDTAVNIGRASQTVTVAGALAAASFSSVGAVSAGSLGVAGALTVTGLSTFSGGAVVTGNLTTSGTSQAATFNATSGYQLNGTSVTVFQAAYASFAFRNTTGGGLGATLYSVGTAGAFVDIVNFWNQTGALVTATGATTNASAGTVTVPAVGAYAVTFSAALGIPSTIAAGGPFVVSVQIVQNGTDIHVGSNGTAEALGSNVHFTVVSGCAIVVCAAGDVLKMQISCGVSSPTTNNLNLNAAFFTVTRVG